MLKHKTADLEGPQLDAAVAMAMGATRTQTETGGFYWSIPGGGMRGAVWSPSTDWAQGGPIIERERICLDGRYRSGAPSSEWWARGAKLPLQFAATPLIAAMRAYVASKFGEEVELP